MNVTDEVEQPREFDSVGNRAREHLKSFEELTVQSHLR